MGPLQEQGDVVGDAQMDVVDRRIHHAHAVVPSPGHPDADEIVGQPPAPANLQRLPEEILRHAGQDGTDRDDGENDQFVPDGVPIAGFEGIEKSPVPLDDLDGDKHIPKFAGDNSGEQGAGPPPLLGAEIRQRHIEKSLESQ